MVDHWSLVLIKIFETLGPELQDDQQIETFLAAAAEVGEKDSSGVFTTTGKEVVEKIGRCLLDDSTRWILLLVQCANLWEAEKVKFSFSGGIRVEIGGIGDQREWVDGFVESLLSGQLSTRPLDSVLQKAVWSGLAQCGGRSVLAVSGAEGEETRAVRLGLSETRWGRAELAPNSFLLLIEPEHTDYVQRLQEQITRELERYACSDKTQVRCGREIKAFLPISPRLDWAADHKERGLPVGLWAWGEEKGGIPLGESFSGLEADGVERKELTFGTFRTCLVGKQAQARSVVAFTHHLKPIPSRVVWLWQGTEVAHHAFDWEASFMAVTLYVEAPGDLVWDISQRQFRWKEEMAEQLDRACWDIKPSLEALVKEYNHYSPRVEGGTIGCWSLLMLGCLALAGVAAPFVGGQIALLLGGLLGLALVFSEFRFRHRKRYALGQSLKELAETLESKSGRLWRKQVLQVDGASAQPVSPDSP